MVGSSHKADDGAEGWGWAQGGDEWEMRYDDTMADDDKALDGGPVEWTSGLRVGEDGRHLFH